MRTAFFMLLPHFCALPETNAHFPVTQCRTQSLSSSHLLLIPFFAPSSCPKVSHRMNAPFSFSRDDDDQMIAGKEFQTIPRHSGQGAATVWAGCPSATRLFCCGNICKSYYPIFLENFSEGEATCYIHCVRNFIYSADTL